MRHCAIVLALFIVCSSAGCQTFRAYPTTAGGAMMNVKTPRELYKSYLPTYRIEPPDILAIDALNTIPRDPYHFRTGDVLGITVQNAFPEAPIAGQFAIQPGGMVDFGPPYAPIRLGNLTRQQAKSEIERVLAEESDLADPQAFVSIVQISGLQQIQGEHLVKADGTVRLGGYGDVRVIGMTLDQAEQAVEAHLSRFLEQPDVSLDVFAFNSKFYYVVLQGGGLGDQVFRFNAVGNETVLDGISQISGLSQVSSKRIWVSRPGPNHEGGHKILPVNYDAIVRQGDVRTNYQLLPGDRLYVEEDKLVAISSTLDRIFAPVERLMGFSLLGANTATRLSGRVLRGGGNPQRGF